MGLVGGLGCRGGGGGVRVDVNEEMKFSKNSKKKNIFFFFFFWGGGGIRGGLVSGWGGQGGCERRIKVFVKIKKKIGWGVGGVRWGDGLGG